MAALPLNMGLGINGRTTKKISFYEDEITRFGDPYAKA